MDFRRRWRLGAMMAVAAAAFWGSAVSWAYGAADLEAARGNDAVRIRVDEIATGPTADAIKRDLWAKELINKYKPELTSQNPDARLNAAIMFASTRTLSSDAVLIEMLSNKDAAVRYWGAKGLGDISSEMSKLGGGALTRVIGALEGAAKGESSGVVLTEIIRALSNYKQVKGILSGLEKAADLIRAGTPEIGLIDAASTGLSALNVSGEDAATKKSAAENAAKLANFTAHQYKAYKDILDATNTPLPAGYKESVGRLIKASLKAMSDAAGKEFKIPVDAERATPEEILFNLNGITGNTDAGGERPGEIQNAIQGVKVPGPTTLGQ